MNSDTESIRQAVVALTQAEKIKAGIIWISQVIEWFLCLPENERMGAEKMLRALVHMVYQEIQLARRSAGDLDWSAVEKHAHKAIVMINSGVPGEGTYHFTRALSSTTTIAQQAMSLLSQHGYF